ncbi:MAG: hypothetical protein AAF497_22455, partial [Planctomycetota bacterium]
MAARLYADVELVPGPDDSFRSKRYKVEIRSSGGEYQDCFVYQSINNANINGNLKDRMAKANHWASLSFDEPVEIRVTLLSEREPNSVLVRPKQRGIDAKIHQGKVTFLVEEPGQFSIEFGENSAVIQHPLLLFANPPDANRPSENNPRIWNVKERGMPPADREEPTIIFFPRGYYNLVREFDIPLRPGYELKSHEHVYLAPLPLSPSIS